MKHLIVTRLNPLKTVVTLMGVKSEFNTNTFSIIF